MLLCGVVCVWRRRGVCTEDARVVWSESRRLSERGAGAQVSQVGPPPAPSARLAHLPRRSVHSHTPAWRLVLRARRHSLHTLASPARRFSLLPIAQFPAPSRRSGPFWTKQLSFVTFHRISDHGRKLVEFPRFVLIYFGASASFKSTA